MPERDRREYQLSGAEVHPRSRLHGIQAAPSGRTIACVIQHDSDAAVTEQDGRPSVRVTPCADLYLMPATGGYPRRLTHWGDQGAAASWSPDGAWLATEHDGRLLVVPVAGGCESTAYEGALYHPPLEQGDAPFGAPRWSPDGTSLLFATRNESRTLLRLAGRDGDWQRTLLDLEGYIIGWDWSPDGRHVAVVTRDEDGWVGDIRVIEVKSGVCHQVSREANYEYQKPMAAWVPRGPGLVVRSNRSGWSKLWVRPPKGGELQPLTTGAWDDYAFRFAPDGRQVVYASRAEQSSSGDDLWIAALAGGAPHRLTWQPGENIPLAWTRGNRVYFWHASPTEPGDVWSVPTAGGKAARLTWSAPVGLERKLRAPEEVCVTSEDGTRVPSLIYLPAYYRDGERYPAIVWIHGGPTGISRYTFAPIHNWLANLGYVVITPNYRGSIGYGVAHMEGVAGEGLGNHDLQDVLAAANYVRTLPHVDISRGIGVGGRSWGGYLTLMAVTQAPEQFSCAVAGAAISDWRIQQASTEVRYYDRWLVGGWAYEQAERVQQRSPVTYADRIKVPLLVYHGEDDRDVPFEQIGPFVDKARKAGACVEYITYPAEGHGNRLPRNQQDVLDRTAAHFRRHLQSWNVRDNPSANQMQY